MVAACGCGGGDPGPMSGRQAFAGRDFGNLFFWQTRTLGFTRDAADSSHGQPHDFLVWQMDEPAPVSALAGIDWRPSLRWPRRFVGDLLATGPAVRARVRPPEPAGGQPAPRASRRRPRTAAATRCATPRRCVPTAARSPRCGGAGRDSIVVGRPPDLRVFTMPGGGSVAAIAFLGVDLALLLAPDDRGRRRGRRVSPGHVVGCADPAGRGDSRARNGRASPDGVTTRPPDVAACSEPSVAPSTSRPARTAARQPCSIDYAKVDADDTVEDRGVRARRERGYDHQARRHQPRSVLHRSPSAGLGKLSRKATRATGLCAAVTSGSVRSRRAKRSPWRPDGGGFTMYGVGNHLNVVNVSDGTCVQPDPSTTLDAIRRELRARQRSPDVGRPLRDHANLVVGGRRRGSRRLPSPAGSCPGPTFRPMAGPSTSGVTKTPGSRSAGSMSPRPRWSNGSCPPTSARRLLFGDRRVLFVDHFNGQDGNGELVLVDLATGAVESLARSVTDVAVARATDAGGPTSPTPSVAAEARRATACG